MARARDSWGRNPGGHARDCGWWRLLPVGKARESDTHSANAHTANAVTAPERRAATRPFRSTLGARRGQDEEAMIKPLRPEGGGGCGGVRLRLPSPGQQEEEVRAESAASGLPAPGTNLVPVGCPPAAGGAAASCWRTAGPGAGGLLSVFLTRSFFFFFTRPACFG